MRLLEVAFARSFGAGSFVDDINLNLGQGNRGDPFQPLCLLGANGSGKSHFLQAVAEAFQAVWHACGTKEEREAHDDGMDFRIVYRLEGTQEGEVILERLGAEGQRQLRMQFRPDDRSAWTDIPLTDPVAQKKLPPKIVAYTSGANETLSVPFFASTLAYGVEVLAMARTPPKKQTSVPEPRLLLMDYFTHLEMLVANLIMGTKKQREYLLNLLPVIDLRSFRCVLRKKDVELTEELKKLVDDLTRCSTTWHYSPEADTYTFDFWITDATRTAFKSWVASAFECYSAFHKLSLLNALAVPASARTRFRNAVNRSRFAARLPEPTDEEKIFRFEQVTFHPKRAGTTGEVDYVAFSDGEHQLIQLLGLFTMIDDENALFLLDEPESHFNPSWRVRFLSLLLETPTKAGTRGSGDAGSQEVLLTTHAPFVPSDMPMGQVLIFEVNDAGAVAIRPPRQQTYGASYEEILQDCFGIEVPISDVSKAEIEAAMSSKDPADSVRTLARIGPSIERAFLEDHLRQLKPRKRRDAVRSAD